MNRPEGLGPQEDGLALGDRIHPDEGARLAEVPEGLLAVAGPGPVRGLGSAHLHPQPEGVGGLSPVAGQDAIEAGAIALFGVFTVNVLPASARGHGEWLATPGRPLAGQLDQVPTYSGPMTGLPLLEEASARAECRVVHRAVLGDHTLFVGLVEDVSEGEAAAGTDPLLFHRGRMRGLL